MQAWQFGVPLAVAAAVALVLPWVLRALPAPVDEPGVQPYARLATRGFVLTAFLLVAAAGLVVLLAAPSAALAWAGLVTCCVPAAMVDARTGYLPRSLAQASWALTAAGLPLTAMLSGPAGLVRALFGAAAAAVLFWTFWRFGRGFGFGDVRLAPVIGAATAAVSWAALFGSLILGGLVGVGWGLIWQARGRGRSFPYGPALVTGPFLAIAVLAPVPA